MVCPHAGIGISLITLAVVLALIAVMIKCHPCRKSYGVMKSDHNESVSYMPRNGTLTGGEGITVVAVSPSLDNDLRPASEDDGEGKLVYRLD